MADLLSTFANAYPYDPNSVWRGAQGVQNVMSNALDYQQKREALEAQRGLRALYAQNPNPSYEDIARISPEFAMQQNKANFELQKEMLGAKKLQGEITQQEAEIFAKTGAQVSEKYIDKILNGSFNREDLSRFHADMGQALADIEKQYGIKPPPGGNVENLDPISVINRAAPYYKSPALDVLYGVQKQGMLNQMPPQMTPQQAYGGVEMGPYGPRRVPGIGGQPMTPGPQYGVTPFNPNAGQMQQGPVPGGMQQAPIGAEDLAVLKQNRAQMQPGPERDALDRMIAEVETGRVAQPPAGGFITAPQETEMRIREKAAEAAAVEAAKSAAGKREIAEQRSDVLSSLPSNEELNQLIDESIASGAENILKGKIEPFIGQSSEALEATKQLEVIQPQLQSLTKALVGAGAVSDYEQRMMANAAASIANPEMPAEPRKAALKVFMDIVKSAMQKYPDLAARLSSQSSAPAQSTAPTKLKIGEVKDGYEYIGGNPKDQSSWKKVR